MNALKKWEIVAELDHSIGLYRHMFRLIDLEDMDLKIRARALITTLRSVLDHLNTECARLAGATNMKGLHFPFAGSVEQLKKDVGQKCRGVPKEIQDYFVSLVPYEDGDQQLYELNKMRNQSDHVALSKFIPSVHGVKIIGMGQDTPPRIIEMPDGAKEIELVKSPVPVLTSIYAVELLYGMRIEGAPHTSALSFDALIARVEHIVNHTEELLIGLGLLPPAPISPA